MPSRAPVSVVVPTYNSERTVLRALQSIAEQIRPPAEIIVVDDCSRDCTAAIVEGFARDSQMPLSIIRLEANAGAANARNVGLDRASQAFVAFLDSDDTWHPDKLRIQYEAFLAHPEYFLLGHTMVNIESHPRGYGPVSPERQVVVMDISLNRLLFKNYFNTPTVMMRKTHLRFDSSQRHAEDYGMWLNVAAANNRLGYIDEPLAAVHKDFYGAAGLSASLWKMERGELTCFAKLRGRPQQSRMILLAAAAVSLLKFVRRWFLVASRQPRSR